MKRRLVKKIGAAILLAILFLVTLIYAPIWDIAPPDVSDLAVVRTEVPPEENAYACFLQATNELYEPPNFSLFEYFHGQTNDDALVSAVIATNQAVIAWIKLGVERPFCQKPDIANNLGPVGRFLEIGALLATRARFERIQGQVREATDATLLLMQYGSRLHQASSLFVEYVAANCVIDMGLTQAAEQVRDKRCGIAERERLTAALAELSFANQGLAKSARGEHVFCTELLEQTRSGRAFLNYADYFGVSKFKRTILKLVAQFVCLPSYLMQYNRTRHLMTKDYRLLVAHAGTAYANHPLRGDNTTEVSSDNVSEADGLLATHSRTHRAKWPFANALGLRLHMSYDQRKTLNGVVLSACKVECKLSAVRLLLACRAYEEATGHLPETLEALVPDYLPAVPRDPFDGQPFRYSAEQRIVYSVGDNLTDDGGTRDYREDKRRRPKDLIFGLFTHESEPPNS
jgi:hypothetical protein